MNPIFEKYCENRHDMVRQWKQETGKKVYGYFGVIAPEEILLAADILPVRITGTGEPLQQADEILPSNCCPFARSCLDAGMQGHYDYLDGVVVPNGCDIMFSMEYFWKTYVKRPHPPSIVGGLDLKPYIHYVNYPVKVDGRQVMPFYLAVLANFKQALERANSIEISDDKLSSAIKAYNDSKIQMNRMYEMRKSDPPSVSGYEAWQAAYASLLMPRDQHAALLKETLDEIEKSGRKAQSGVRIYLSGSVMDHVNADLIKLIEECGGQVVTDDLTVGTRSFWNPLDADLPPMEAIAQRSLGTACPRSTVKAKIPEHRWAHLTKTLNGFEVEGAIFYVLKCCDARLSEYPHLRDKLKEEMNIPSLFLEGDYTAEGVEQLRGRVEAFIEMIGG